MSEPEAKSSVPQDSPSPPTSDADSVLEVPMTSLGLVDLLEWLTQENVLLIRLLFIVNGDNSGAAR